MKGSARSSLLSGLDHPQAGHLCKVALVKRFHPARMFQRRSCHNEVVVADHVAGRLKFYPDLGMLKRGHLSIGKYRQHFEDHLEIGFAAVHMTPRRACTPCHNSATVIAAMWG